MERHISKMAKWNIFIFQMREQWIKCTLKCCSNMQFRLLLFYWTKWNKAIRMLEIPWNGCKPTIGSKQSVNEILFSFYHWTRWIWCIVVCHITYLTCIGICQLKTICSCMKIGMVSSLAISSCKQENFIENSAYCISVDFQSSNTTAGIFYKNIECLFCQNDYDINVLRAYNSFDAVLNVRIKAFTWVFDSFAW